jgi:hypothetical protein
MGTAALMLSRLQFAFTVSFHIIFPSFTIGLAAWLTVLEALHLITGRPAYRRVFDFWLKIVPASQDPGATGQTGEVGQGGERVQITYACNSSHLAKAILSLLFGEREKCLQSSVLESASLSACVASSYSGIGRAS